MTTQPVGRNRGAMPERMRFEWDRRSAPSLPVWIEQKKRDGWGWDHNVPPIEHADGNLGFEFFTLCPTV